MPPPIGEAAKMRAVDMLEKGPGPETDAYLAIETALRRYVNEPQVSVFIRESGF